MTDNARSMKAVWARFEVIVGAIVIARYVPPSPTSSVRNDVAALVIVALIAAIWPAAFNGNAPRRRHPCGAYACPHCGR